MLILFVAFLVYDNYYLEKGQSAIIYIKGSANYDWDGFTNEQLENFESQCAYYMITLADELSQSWGWDFYSFVEQEPDFRRFQYDTLLIFFDGHGSFRNDDNQYFLFEEESVRVDKISSKISCNNLTVVVNSCFSVNWLSEFTHDNLNSLYTNDLENKQTKSRIYYDSNLDVTDVYSYSRFFIDFLQYGVNYSFANSTAISIYYSLNLTGIDS